MADEVDLYADVDKIHMYETFDIKKPSQQNTTTVSFYVGNLTWWTSDFDLEMAIRRLGVYDILEVKIHESNANGQSKGFALVNVRSEAGAKAVMEKLPRGDLNGTRPVVTPANSQTLKEFESAFEEKQGDRTERKDNGSSGSSVPPLMPFPIGNVMPPIPPPGMPPITPPGIPPVNIPGVLPPPGFPPSQFPPGVPPPGFPPVGARPPGMPPMPMMPPMHMGGAPPNWFPKADDRSDEDLINENQKTTNTAIKEAVDLATISDYGASIACLLQAIGKVKSSKVGKHDRTKVMLSSLNDCLHGIEEKSFGAPRRDSHDRGKRRERRERSRDRDRRERSSSRDRDRDRKRARSRSRERRRSDYDDRERDRR